MWGHRIVIPKSLREELLAELHASHMGIVRMKSIARSYTWWFHIDRNIEDIGKKCEPCLINAKYPPKVKLHTRNWPDGPNNRVHADFLGPLEGGCI